jgi:hypothetical protein
MSNCPIKSVVATSGTWARRGIISKYLKRATPQRRDGIFSTSKSTAGSFRILLDSYAKSTIAAECSEKLTPQKQKKSTPASNGS